MKVIVNRGTIHALLAAFILVWLFGGVMDFFSFIPHATIYVAFIVWLFSTRNPIDFLGRVLYKAWPIYCLLLVNVIAFIIFPSSHITAHLTAFMYICVIHIMSEYYLQEGAEVERTLIFYALLINIVIVGIITYSRLQLNPNLSRYLGTGLERYEEIVKSQDIVGKSNYSGIDIRGVGSYGYFNALPFLLVVLLFAIKEYKGKKKILSLIAVLAIMFLSIKASFLTTILLAILLIGVMIIKELVPSIRARIILYMIVFATAFFLWVSGIATLLLSIVAAGINNSTISVRIGDIASFLTGDMDYSTNDFASRIFLLTKSAKTFLSSPLWGTIGGPTTGKVGGHSTLFDVLAIYGIFGLLFYSFWDRVKKTYYRKIDYWPVVNLGSLYLFLVLLLNNGMYAQIFIGYLIIIPFGAAILGENLNRDSSMLNETYNNRIAC